MAMVTAELSRDVAYEAVRRGPAGNVHELWSVLDLLDEVRPALIVDVGSGPAVWWAWWSMCPNVIGVADFGAGDLSSFSGDRLPSSVVALSGDPAERHTALRVADQVARRPVDVLVLAELAGADFNTVRALWGLYAPKVRPGGVVLLRGIANPECPGVADFWRGLQADDQRELIGAVDPDGYGVIRIPGQVNRNG